MQKNFWGGAWPPLQTPPPLGRRTSPPHTLGAFGASLLACGARSDWQYLFPLILDPDI